MGNELPASKAQFYASGYVGDVGRVLLIVAADFLKRNVWIGEAYVIFSDSKLSSGLRQSSSCESVEPYEQFLPAADDVLRDRLLFARGMFWSRMRKLDRDLASWLVGSGEPFKEVTQQEVAGLHFSGEFGDQIVELLRFTEAAALRDALNEFARLRKFRVRRESLNDSM